MYPELISIDLSKVAINQDTKFTRDGYPILNPPPDRLILPEELQTLEQKRIHRVGLFDMSDPKQVEAYSRVMTLHLDGKLEVRARIVLEPNEHNPNLRIHVEWYEIWVYFRENKPNSRYLDRAGRP